MAAQPAAAYPRDLFVCKDASQLPLTVVDRHLKWMLPVDRIEALGLLREGDAQATWNDIDQNQDVLDRWLDFKRGVVGDSPHHPARKKLQKLDCFFRSRIEVGGSCYEGIELGPHAHGSFRDRFAQVRGNIEAMMLQCFERLDPALKAQPPSEYPGYLLDEFLADPSPSPEDIRIFFWHAFGVAFNSTVHPALFMRIEDDQLFNFWLSEWQACTVSPFLGMKFARLVERFGNNRERSERLLRFVKEFNRSWPFEEIDADVYEFVLDNQLDHGEIGIRFVTLLNNLFYIDPTIFFDKFDGVLAILRRTELDDIWTQLDENPRLWSVFASFLYDLCPRDIRRYGLNIVRVLTRQPDLIRFLLSRDTNLLSDNLKSLRWLTSQFVANDVTTDQFISHMKGVTRVMKDRFVLPLRCFGPLERRSHREVKIHRDPQAAIESLRNDSIDGFIEGDVGLKQRSYLVIRNMADIFQNKLEICAISSVLFAVTSGLFREMNGLIYHIVGLKDRLFIRSILQMSGQLFKYSAVSLIASSSTLYAIHRMFSHESR